MLVDMPSFLFFFFYALFYLALVIYKYILNKKKKKMGTKGSNRIKIKNEKQRHIQYPYVIRVQFAKESFLFGYR